MRSLTSVLFVMSAACSGSNAKPDAIVLVHEDAPVDVTVPPGPNQVTLMTFTPPTLIAYRDGKGPWLIPATTAANEYVLNVTNDYEWLVVCSGSEVDAEEGRATFGDGASQYAFCFADGAEPTTVQITGTMVQAGQLWMTDTAMSATANWSFTLAVPPGTHDLIAVGDNRMLVHRAQTVTAAAAIGSLDLDANGTAMTSVPLTVNDLGSDSLYTSLELGLANDSAQLEGSSTTIVVPPASLLMPSDYEFLYLNASSLTGDRTAETLYTGTQTTFTLMPPLTGVTLAPVNGAETAAWATLPASANADVYLYGAALQQHVSATDTWLAATGATTLAFDASAPGWDATWTVDVTGSYFGVFDAATTSGGISYSSGIEDGGGSSVRRLPEQRARIARARAARR